MRRTLLFVLSILMVMSLVPFFGAQSAQVSYCAERTIDGAWCQNVPLDQVDQNFRSAPTSCEASSYCQLGTCIDRDEGKCLANTPQRVCEDNGGMWDSRERDEVEQCQLGCCLLGDQAAYVTQARCNQLSALYGLEIDYQAEIGSEVQCILSATSDQKGACAYDEGLSRTCRFVTQAECQEIGASLGEEAGVDFHPDTLCTDPSLGTECAPSEQTTCIEGRDEVFFVDTCGNIANIYDSNWEQGRPDYWSEVYSKAESCGAGTSNAGDASCGSCDYFLGSTCKAYERGEDLVRPNEGDYVCADLACEYLGQTYEHGETWCADAEGVSEIYSGEEKRNNPYQENVPGSRYYRMMCYNGEVIPEPCADYRQEVCIESSIDDFSTAACRVNRWEDCSLQDEKDDCENRDRRDCQWVDNIALNTGSQSAKETTPQPFRGTTTGQQAPITGNQIFGGGNDEEPTPEYNADGACVPLWSPGMNFWDAQTTELTCYQANAECVVVFEEGLLGGGRECVENCECLDDDWEESMKLACVALGDCGASVNYLGQQGDGDGFTYKKKG